MKIFVKKKTRLDSIQAYATCYCPVSSCGSACNGCNTCIPDHFAAESEANSIATDYAEQVMYDVRGY